MPASSSDRSTGAVPGLTDSLDIPPSVDQPLLPRRLHCPGSPVPVRMWDGLRPERRGDWCGCRPDRPGRTGRSRCRPPTAAPSTPSRDSPTPSAVSFATTEAACGSRWSTNEASSTCWPISGKPPAPPRPVLRWPEPAHWCSAERPSRLKLSATPGQFLQNGDKSAESDWWVHGAGEGAEVPRPPLTGRCRLDARLGRIQAGR